MFFSLPEAPGVRRSSEGHTLRKYRMRQRAQGRVLQSTQHASALLLTFLPRAGRGYETAVRAPMGTRSNARIVIALQYTSPVVYTVLVQ